MKDKNTQYICAPCKYTTTIEHNMRYHEKTKKHKKNLEADRDDNYLDALNTFITDTLMNIKNRQHVKVGIIIDKLKE
jgi:hypothetical protein